MLNTLWQTISPEKLKGTLKLDSSQLVIPFPEIVDYYTLEGLGEEPFTLDYEIRPEKDGWGDFIEFNAETGIMFG